MNKPKIYLTAIPGGIGDGDYIGQALAEDGTGICRHLSSSLEFAKHDMGLTSDWKHEHYKKYYPDGYELEWVDKPAEHEGWQAALKLNKAKQEANSE
jgi:hypothetical protein